jgi:hypothetical protein
MFNYKNAKLLVFFVIHDKYVGYVTHSMTHIYKMIATPYTPTVDAGG